MSTALSAGVGRTSLQLSQAELASWIGVSRETVERVLRDWRERGIIDIVGGFANSEGLGTGNPGVVAPRA
jgi:DNA-binding transcriptional regulator LsrR (DeoR family)